MSAEDSDPVDKVETIETRSFDEIETKQIRIVDDAGVMRLALSAPPMPNATFRGEEMLDQKRQEAGILYFTEEGTECGGLAFSGKTNKRVEAVASMTMDAYEQDQVLWIHCHQRANKRSYGISMSDRPLSPIKDLVDRYLKMPKWRLVLKFLLSRKTRRDFKEGQAPRLFMGRERNGDVRLNMMDSKGKPRIRIVVDHEDNPRMEFLDDRGKVSYRLPPD